MSETIDPPAVPVSEDALFAGQLRLLQPAAGHRAGTDAVLLAASLPPEALRIADLGAGSGVVGLRAAQMNPAAVSLIEREPDLIALARANIERNGLAARVTAEALDVFRLGKVASLREAFDCVLSNPPFFNAGDVRISSNAHRARSHVLAGTLSDWLRNAATILAPKGTLVLIHRADALGEILEACGTRLGGLRLRFIHAEADAPAIRVLISGRKGSRASLAVLPPVILNASGGGFTPETAALHAGNGRIDMTGTG